MYNVCMPFIICVVDAHKREIAISRPDGVGRDPFELNNYTNCFNTPILGEIRMVIEDLSSIRLDFLPETNSQT